MSKTPKKQIEELAEQLSPADREELIEHLREHPTTDRPSTAQSLLKYAGKWQGTDLEQCLDSVYETRSTVKF